MPRSFRRVFLWHEEACLPLPFPSSSTKPWKWIKNQSYYVDLTAPDAGRPDDDPAWFCLRVGCDQSHEQVDREALDRSFFMRVCHGGEKPQREATEGYRQEEPELDAEIPALCTAEASESSVREAERRDRGRGEGTGGAQAKGRADLRHASVHNSHQDSEGRMSQPEEEGTDHAAEQGRPAKAEAVPQREAPEGAVGRCSLQPGKGRSSSLCSLFMSTTPKKEPIQTPAADKSKGGGVQGLFEAELGNAGRCRAGTCLSLSRRIPRLPRRVKRPRWPRARSGGWNPRFDVTAQQLGEPRPAFNNGIQRKAVEPERVSRAASSTRTTKPA
ncbi:hypothetical protein ACJX0J_042545, partial [Zea mays]